MRYLTESRQIKITIVIFSLIASLLACSSTKNEKIEPNADQPIANFPVMTTGEQWVTSSRHGVRSNKVIDVKADGSFIIEVQNEDGSIILHQYYDKNYCLTKQLNTTTGSITKIPTPPAQPLNFPLFVGKTWEDEYRGLDLNNKIRTYKSSYKVERIEMVSTAAGTFKAFKIYRTIHVSGRQTPLYESNWYSTDLKLVCKSQLNEDIITETGFSVHLELLSYQKAPDDQKALQTGVTPGPSKENTNAAKQKNERDSDISRESPSKKVSIVGARWAVLIGISQYKDTRIAPLRYAAADARSFYDWIVSPQGGKYAPSMVKLLTDADATGANIKNALFDWLSQAIDEDTVTIYFAGHGSPQSPDHLENLFLLPYDTQYDSLHTTGFPMWDIETALKRFIKAKKVIVMTDACHAGGVGHAFDIARRSGRGITTISVSSSLQNLSKVSEGVCIISASDDNQLSQESSRWGGGHGVFTFNLLEGLKGEADYNKDGIVTLGEIIPFLSEQVRRETRNAQTPTVAGRFDPALSIGK